MSLRNHPFLAAAITAATLVLCAPFLAAQGTTITNCYKYSSGTSVSCTSTSLPPARRTGWAGALEAFADGLAEAAAQRERDQAVARQRALDEQYRLMVNSILEERAAQARALDSERALAAQRETQRIEAAYRIFQPKFVAVARQFVDSIGIRGEAYKAVLAELNPVAQDIFAASPDASEAKIRDDLRPLFRKYGARVSEADAALTAWIKLRRPRLSNLSKAAQDLLVDKVEGEYNAFVAGKHSQFNSTVFDQGLEYLETNRKLCVELEAACDEALLNVSEQKGRGQRILQAQNRRKRELAAVPTAIARFASLNREMPSAMRPILTRRVLEQIEQAPVLDAIDVKAIIQNEATDLINEVASCRAGQSCRKSLVDAETYSRYRPAYSDEHRRVCGGSIAEECKVLRVDSDRPRESVTVNGVLLGTTPLVAAVRSKAGSLQINIGEGVWLTSTVVPFGGDSAVLTLSVKTVRVPGTVALPSRANVASSLGDRLPSLPRLAPLPSAEPIAPQAKRVTIFGLAAIPIMGGIAYSTCSEGYERTSCLRDGLVMGAMFGPITYWFARRSYRKARKSFDEQRASYDRSVEERSLANARRETMIDSVLTALRKTAENEAPVRSVSVSSRFR